MTDTRLILLVFGAALFDDVALSDPSNYVGSGSCLEVFESTRGHLFYKDITLRLLLIIIIVLGRRSLVL